MKFATQAVMRQWPLVTIVLCSLFLSVVESLQCFTCRGVPYYDPDLCFKPVRGRTVRQECSRGEVCETRIHRSETFDKIIERGCTNACGLRQFVWTDYFQVHCCRENDCNAGISIVQSLPVMLAGLLAVYLLLRHR